MRPAALKAIRSKLGLTQAQLADRLGITQNTVARWEMGVRKVTEPMARFIHSVAVEARKKKRRRSS